jgi:hypothetical protein
VVEPRKSKAKACHGLHGFHGYTRKSGDRGEVPPLRCAPVGMTESGIKRFCLFSSNFGRLKVCFRGWPSHGTVGNSLDENTLLLQEQACRRAHERTAVDVPVILISTHRGTTSFHEARTADLCEGGMGVVTSAPLTAHQAISIEIVVPLANQLLKLNAVVKHQRACEALGGDCYGLEFYAATEAQRKQLKRMAYDS